jgi:hypothetical protein|tara:strand:+ start:154 stop:477 length:324 start_codon:yes stop_codon:yes gene_type:complete
MSEFTVIFGIPLLLVIIFIYTGLGVLTREIFADKKCNIHPISTKLSTSTPTKASVSFNNIIEGFSNNAVKLDLNEHELVFSKGAIVLLWIIVIILTIAAVSALAMLD